MIKNIFFLFFIIIIATSCSDRSTMAKEIKSNLNKIVVLDTTSSVMYNDSILAFNVLKDYKYISLVYLANGCRPCYKKYMDWQENMNSAILKQDCTVLFIIENSSYSDFILDIQTVEDSIKTNYYFIEDYGYKFLYDNASIPRHIIDKSLLINNENKIILIGKPFANEGMKNLYKQIVSNAK